MESALELVIVPASYNWLALINFLDCPIFARLDLKSGGTYLAGHKSCLYCILWSLKLITIDSFC
jgi:hypothetical protein